MFYFIFHLFKTSLFFRDALANHLDCSMEVLFAKAFLFTPGKTRGFFMLKATKKVQLINKNQLDLLLMNKKMRILGLLASHPIFLFKLNKSGFDECYQSAIKWEI